MEINEAISHLGNYGKWQIFNFVVLSTISMSVVCVQMLSIVFTGYKPPHECKLPFHNYSDILQMSCATYLNSSNHSVPCQHGWNFPNFTGSTIVTDWELVCNDEHLPSTSQTLLTIGHMLGVMLFGCLTDKFGRKKLTIIATFLISIVSLLICFSPSIKLFMFFRFCTGFIIPGVVYAPYVLLCETFSIQQRENVGIMSQVFWSIACCFLPVLAYYIENWRYYQLCLSLFSFLILPFTYFLRESVLWDISKGRIDHAEETLRIAAKINGVTFTEPIFAKKELEITIDEKFKNRKSLIKREQKPDKKSQNDETLSFLKLFTNKTMLFYSSAMSFLTVVNTLVYYGIYLSTGVIQGNRFWNAFYGSFLEVLAVILSLIITKNFGKRRCMMYCYMLTAVFSFFTVLVDHQQEVFKSAGPILFGVLTNSTRFFISIAFITAFLYAGELFPTSLRNSAIGIYTFFGKVGNLLGIYGAYFSERNINVVMFLYGIFSVMASLLIILLPETQNKPLPNTIQEAKDLQKK